MQTNTSKFLLLFISCLSWFQTTAQKNNLQEINITSPFESKKRTDSIALVKPSKTELGITNHSTTDLRITTQGFFLKVESKAIDVANFESNFNVWFGLDKDHSIAKLSDSTDALGVTHRQYQHYFKGYKVEGSSVLVHSKDGILSILNGHIERINNLNISILTVPEDARNVAMKHLNVLRTIHDYPAELVVKTIVHDSARSHELCYKVRIDSDSPLIMKNVYVSAQTKKILNTVSLIAHSDVKGTGKTLYSGNQSIICDSYSGKYRLRDNGRKIQTYDATNSSGLTNNGYAGSSDFMNSSTTWVGVPILDEFTVKAVANNWWYTAFSDENPDLYIIIKDKDGQIVHTSGYYSNIHPTVTWTNLGVYLVNGPYTAELWDFDPLGSDDFGGSYTVATSTGTQTWSGNSNNGTYVIANSGHPALDVHWGMEVSYDFYLDSLSRNSFDGKGAVIKQYLNPPGFPKNNAAAYGAPLNIMAYGMGDGKVMNPVVALDVEGHEFTHLVIDNNGNGGLKYEGESGALNESFADIFGTCIEFYSGVDTDWNLGEGILVNEPYFRSLSNPNSADQPDTYRGTYWVNPANLTQDHGGVHTNSGVQNYWFYLLAEGGSGINDLSNSYSVTKIGLSKARDIAYRTLTTYLTSTATYEDAYYGSLQSAEDLFGNPSAEYNAVRKAWYAVGIGNNPDSYCSGITNLTEPTGVVSDGSGSANYHNNAECAWLIAPAGATQITLDFTAFDTEAGYDTVFVYDGPDDSSPLLATWWGSTLPSSIKTSNGVGAMFIRFTSDALTTGKGWTAKYSSSGSKPSCGGGTLLSETSGNLSDGSGAFDYGNNQLCYWFISPPCAKSVTLSFSKFDTESGFDGVVVYDDLEGSNILGVYSGTTIPSSVTSNTGVMLVAFVSDYATVSAGFTASYTSTGSAHCTGNTIVNTSDWGVVSDGSGSDNYCNNSECSWLIQPPNATSVTLTFSEFDLEPSTVDGQTIFDAVEIYDGTSTSATLLGTYSGSSLPPSLTSTTGNMYVRFYSDLDINGKGWKATYTSTQNTYCDGLKTLTTENGTLSDGSGGNDYANNSACSWLIEPTGATSITLTFSELQTEAGQDGVIVYDGNDNSSNLLGKFSGSTIPGPLTSTGGAMFMEFNSDPQNRDEGWSAEYTSSSVNVNDVKQQSYLSLYPNPAKKSVSLTSTQKTSVVIINVLGKEVVKSVEVGAGETKNIDLSYISGGTYFIVSRNSTTSVVLKLIVQ